MKIALCSDRYVPSEGGVERYVENLATELAKRHSVTVFAVISRDQPYGEFLRGLGLKGGSRRLKDDRGFEVFWVVPPFPKLLSLVLKAESLRYVAPRSMYYAITNVFSALTAYCLSLVLRNELSDFDVIHSMAPWQISHGARYACRGKPHVITGFMHEGFWADDKFSVRHFAASATIVALCEAEKQSYIRKGILERLIAVVPVPSPRANGPSESKNVSAAIANPNRMIVLFVGVKREYKGIDLMLAAADIMEGMRPDVLFVFVGPGTTYSDNLFCTGRKRGNVLDVGFVSDSEKREFLRRSTVLCLPSATEIMPTVILEAWEEGVPVIASGIPTIEDFVGDAGTLIKRDPQAIVDAVCDLIDKPSLRSLLKERGRIRLAAKHSPSAIASSLERIYEEVCA